MLFFNKFSLILSISAFLFTSFLASHAFAAAVYTGHYCTNGTSYRPNSTFQGNLTLVLASLVSNASYDASGSNYAIIGFGTTDAVNGHYLCRGDLDTDDCRDCVSVAAKQIIVKCPNQTEAVIWYDLCMVRYTNSYFRYDSLVPGMNLTDAGDVSTAEFNQFNQSLFSLLDNLGTEAANSRTEKKFATGDAKIASSTTTTVTVYALAQCLKDLTSGQCEKCLKNAAGVFPTCCGGSQGARILLSSCNVRYELFKFYNGTTASSSPPVTSGKKKLGSGTIAMIVVLVIVFILLLCLGCYFYLRRSRKNSRTILRENFGKESATLESLHFNLATVEAATKKFSLQNKIGQGGFGEVYKGVLPDGREIAVKKLSKSSGQGSIEFNNEILLIAKLQHRNLVTLLGFCLEAEEKMLIYEYVPNKSLDYFLFRSEKKRLLNWVERYKIIEGIARGILYLHEHSRLKVIHRDLKPSNVLLDDNMNPKISDFGLARMVTIGEDPATTKRIVGTFGYMAPEYAMHGQFSEKSDVFSFGVITLEIISAKKNARSLESNSTDDLLSHSWRQWRDQTPLEILDPYLKDACPHSQVIKCIQIGLLCVQENPDDRPTMAKIVSYLSSSSEELPIPLEYRNNGIVINMVAGESSSSSTPLVSVNNLSISHSFPR